jgi:hypothetical protein
VLAVLLFLGPAGCAGPRAAESEKAEDAVQSLFDRRAAAVLAGDRDRLLQTVDPRSRDYARQQHTVAANLARLPVASWSYDLHRLALDGSRAEAEVELRYRLTEHAGSSVRTTERFALRRRDGRWHLAGERPESSRHLWEQGSLRVVRGEHSLVLGTVDRAALLRVAGRAERAVPAVSRQWPEPWPRHTVVLVPGSVRDMAELLSGAPSTYEGIAAVTTGPNGDEPGKGKRIVVNRQAFGLLSDRGRQVVMTHETAHVATRAHTGDATPLWLSEGLADWVGHRGTESAPATAAPTLARAVRAGNLPHALPADSQFGFTTSPEALARAYEGGWLACRMVAERWGADRLAALYVAVGEADGPQAAAVDRALRDVLGTGTAEFTRMWRSTLRTQLAGS